MLSFVAALRLSEAIAISVCVAAISPDKANMRQLRIKIMNAPAAVTPMTLMAATAKIKYAVGRSSSSATPGSR